MRFKNRINANTYSVSLEFGLSIPRTQWNGHLFTKKCILFSPIIDSIFVEWCKWHCYRSQMISVFRKNGLIKAAEKKNRLTLNERKRKRSFYFLVPSIFSAHAFFLLNFNIFLCKLRMIFTWHWMNSSEIDQAEKITFFKQRRKRLTNDVNQKRCRHDYPTISTVWWCWQLIFVIIIFVDAVIQFSLRWSAVCHFQYFLLNQFLFLSGRKLLFSYKNAQVAIRLRHFSK